MKANGPRASGGAEPMVSEYVGLNGRNFAGAISR